VTISKRKNNVTLLVPESEILLKGRERDKQVFQALRNERRIDRTAAGGVTTKTGWRPLTPSDGIE
jgi:hypothetical protein